MGKCCDQNQLPFRGKFELFSDSGVWEDDKRNRDLIMIVFNKIFDQLQVAGIGED